jgi:DNA-binding MarR family transcriptional regulator
MKEDFVDTQLQQWAQEHPQKDVSSLSVVVRLQLLNKLLQRQTTAALSRHGLKHWEYDVLSVLRRQGEPFELPATEIARAAMLTTGAMTTRINGLEARGLVRRRKSKDDGRSVRVRLTIRGRQLIDFAIDTRLDQADEALANISTNDKKRLAADLRRLLLEFDSMSAAPRN